MFHEGRACALSRRSGTKCLYGKAIQPLSADVSERHPRWNHFNLSILLCISKITFLQSCVLVKSTQEFHASGGAADIISLGRYVSSTTMPCLASGVANFLHIGTNR